MDGFFIYLLKAGACLGCFYLVYRIFFSKLTFFAFNRFYLVAGIALSFAIPLLEIQLPAPLAETAAAAIIPQNIAENGATGGYITEITQTDIYKGETLNYLPLVPVIYFAGVAALLFRLLSSFVRIRRLKKRASVVSSDGHTVFEAEGVSPFSFFNMIFVPKSGDSGLIVEHEKVHIRQRHWADLLFMEAAALLLWFNPFVFLYRRALKSQHEYLADNSITRNKESVPEYLGCMLRQVQAANCGALASSFFCKTIKKRVIMITKNKTSRKFASLYLLAIPVIAVLAIAFASYTYAQQPAQPTVAQTAADTDDPKNYIPSIFPVDAGKAEIRGSFGPRGGTFTSKHGVDSLVFVHLGTLKEAAHSGLDLQAPAGTNVVSTANGTVVRSSSNQTHGNYIEIKHSDEYFTFYSHLENRTVKEGDRVTKGQKIGTVGNTGKSTGPHLHYEIRKNGKPVDPADYLNRIPE